MNKLCINLGINMQKVKQRRVIPTLYTQFQTYTGLEAVQGSSGYSPKWFVNEFCPQLASGLVLISCRAAIANLISVESMLLVPQTPQYDAVIRNDNGLHVSWKLHCSSHTTVWRTIHQKSKMTSIFTEKFFVFESGYSPPQGHVQITRLTCMQCTGFLDFFFFLILNTFHFQTHTK